MKSKTKRSVIIFFAAALILFFAIFAIESCVNLSIDPYEEAAADTDRVIRSADITINVAEDKTAYVVEKYDIYYDASTFAFDRYLPRTNGERYYDIHASVTSGAAYDWYVSNDRSLTVVSVEFPNKRLTGLHSYEIRYKLIPGKQSKNNSQTFYMNVVGQGFVVAQKNVSVAMHFPDAVESGVFYQGKWGEKGKLSDDHISYSQDNKSVFIRNVALNAYEGVTVDLKLPKGTFTGYFDWYILLAAGLSALLIGLLILFKFLFAKNAPVTPVVNFYPTEDEEGKELTPVDMGFLIDHTCDSSDVTSMIYYWASKGYLNIIDESGDKISLQKLKDLPKDARDYESTIFYGIFKSGDLVSLDSLQDKFYVHMERSKRLVKARYEGRLLEKKNKTLAAVALIMSMLLVVAYTVASYFRLGSYRNGLWMILSAIPPFLVYLYGTYFFHRYHKYTDATRRNGLFFLCGSAFLLSVLSVFVMGNITMSGLERAFIVGGGMIGAMIAPFLNKRTQYYSAKLNDIVGFKNFLTTVEKDRIELLLQDHPQYYYDILPYANVLGVTAVWQQKFASLAMSPPPYYYSTSDAVFNMIVFNSFFRHSLSSFSAVSARPNATGSSRSGSGGGFGGGGGFSGGGFGGGGGGFR